MGSAAKAGVKRAVKATSPRGAAQKAAKKSPAKRTPRKG
jgi:hypothetical protein